MTHPLVFSIGPKGDRIARAVAQLLAAPVHLCGPGREDAQALVRPAYERGAPIIGVCSCGALVRMIAPVLGTKIAEPPVVAVSSDGKIVVPLLGVHRGANALARWVAEGFRGTAAVTAFSDTLYEFPLDDLPPGYVLATPEAVRPVMAALLNGETLKVDGPSAWLELAGYPVSDDGTQAVTVSERVAQGPGVVIHPRTLVAGVGCTTGARGDAVIALIEATLADAELSRESLAAIATLDARAEHPAIHAAAAHFDVPVRVFAPEALALESARLETPSDAVADAVGLAGVCEAVALKAGTLAVKKTKGANVTCAIGRGASPIDPMRFGDPAT